MKNNKLHLWLELALLVIGGAAEELLPNWLGVGFPVLLALAQVMAVRHGMINAVVFALAAGMMEDSLSSLPLIISASYFLIAALLARWLDLPRLMILLTYPGYRLWLGIWGGVPLGKLAIEFMLALPIGFVTAWVVVLVVWQIERKAALDEAG